MCCCSLQFTCLFRRPVRGPGSGAIRASLGFGTGDPDLELGTSEIRSTVKNTSSCQLAENDSSQTVTENEHKGTPSYYEINRVVELIQQV